MKMELTETQVNALFKMMDTELKVNGIASLITVVDLYNVVTAAIQASKAPNTQVPSNVQ